MSSSNEMPQNENIPLNIKNAHNLVKKVNPKEISKELENKDINIDFHIV